MNTGVASAYRLMGRFSRACTLLAIALFAAFKVANFSLGISTQLVIATIALGIGIPHGAIDHLVAMPSHPRRRFVAYIIGYVALAVVAVVLIASWQRVGFDLVVAMSALHFGFGDASYFQEGADFSGEVVGSRLDSLIYALPAGLIPLILPLTNALTTPALTRINSHLVNWAGGESITLRAITFSIGGLGFAWLALRRRWALAVDLLLLGVLALATPPLITFAVYFGCWHAVRHTARLVPKLPRALKAASSGGSGQAIWAAVWPGLYALVGTLAVAVFLMLTDRHGFASSMLWSALVIVWALTVPHMLTTARFDLRSLRLW